MANQRKPMHLIRHLLQLQKEGKSIRQMSRLLGISRNTVRHYLRQLAHAPAVVLPEEQSGQQLEGLLKKSDRDVTALNRYQGLESRFEELEKELIQPGVNRYVLWLEYKQQIPEGYQYSQFCYHYQQWRRSRQATLHLEHKAGDKLFVDFAGEKLQLIDPDTGASESLEAFVAILGCSQLTYACAVKSQRKEDFLSCLAGALHYFGGVPEAIVPDNLKSAVTKADRYEPELNESLTDFALHYQTVILPARVAKPKDKALVEGAVNIIYSRVYAPLRKQVFTSLQELNAAIGELVEQHNQKLFQGRSYSRRQVFEEQEKAFLKPLPTTAYQLKHYQQAKVQKNCHVLLSADKHYYSVPYRYIGKLVKLIYTSEWVEIYCHYERIATHQRNLRKHGYSTHKEHLPSHHQWVVDWNPDKFRRWASGIGVCTEKAVEMLLTSRAHPEQAYKSCIGILSLEKKVGKDRLEKACSRALLYGGMSYKLVRSILDKGLEQIPEEFTIPADATLQHENIRGKQAYQ